MSGDDQPPAACCTGPAGAAAWCGAHCLPSLQQQPAGGHPCSGALGWRALAGVAPCTPPAARTCMHLSTAESVAMSRLLPSVRIPAPNSPPSRQNPGHVLSVLHLQAGPVQTPAAVAAASAAGFALQPQQPQQLQQQQGLSSPPQLDAVYRQFLENTLVKEFHRLSRSLPDIQSQAAVLWPKYLSGAAKQQQQQDINDGVSCFVCVPPPCVTVPLCRATPAGPSRLCCCCMAASLAGPGPRAQRPADPAAAAEPALHHQHVCVVLWAGWCSGVGWTVDPKP